MGGKYRIFVIDEVHMLSNSAFNALLKTLEEPPPNVIFIFATTEPQKIPPTIHSRCQRYDFRRIVPEQIFDRLVHICSEEKIAYEKPALMLIARKAEGSMRDALSLLDQVCSYNPEKLAEKEVRQVLGLVDMEVYGKLMDAVAAKTAAPVLSTVQEVLYQGYDLHEFVLGLEEHLRNLLFSRMKGALESAGLALEPIVAEAFRRSAERFSEGDLLRMLEIVRKSENELKWSALPRFAVEMTLLKLVFLDSTLSLDALLALLGNAKEASIPAAALPVPTAPPAQGSADVKKKNDSGTLPVASDYATIEKPPLMVREETPPAAEPADDGPLSNGYPAEEGPDDGADSFEDRSPEVFLDIKKQWPAFLELLMRDWPNLGTFLSLATIVGSSESSIDLSYSPKLKFQFGEMTKKQNREEIIRMLAVFMNRPIEVHIALSAEKAEEHGQNAVQPAPLAPVLDNEIEREPVIQAVLELFDGEIIR
jgi:DNA polymerase-3 subunit gamma/tau